MNAFKRILALFRRDMKAATRDFMLVYMLAAPFLLALVLRFFIPGLSASVLRLAVDDTVDAAAADHLRQYAAVSVHDDYQGMADRVAAADDVVGISREADGYVLLMEGNEAEDLSDLITRMLDGMDNGRTPALRVTGSDIDDLRSPLSMYGLAGVLLLAVMLGGMMIGMAIIEEKEEFTLSAVNVTPVTRSQYLAGKCAIGILVPLGQMALLPLFMGVTGIHYGQLLYTTVAGLTTGVVLGITMGIISPSQVAGIANMKFLVLAVSASFIGVIVIPQSYQYFLYWSAYYWSVRGYLDVIWGAASWGPVLTKGLWTLLLSGVLLAALSRYIRRGLSSIGI